MKNSKESLKHARKLVHPMSDSKHVKNMIETLESGMYGSVNEDGEDVIVFLEKNVGIVVRTFQSNGWLRVNDFDKDGYMECETFEGRWDKK